MIFKLENSINQHIKLPNKLVELYIKREDAIHPFVSGNKYRKLKYNLLEAKKHNYDTMLTFGGAFSNHIAAVAAAGKGSGLKTIGVIRGEELAEKVASNATLSFAKANGMDFKFVSRETYRSKTNPEFLEALKKEFGSFYHIPEGGTNAFAIKGCEEILTPEDSKFNYICTAVGTGGTISGLINCLKPSQQVLGFPALKGDFLKEDISKFANKSNWELITDYHFGGYAKINEALIAFINTFKQDYGIALDPVYTGKMLFGILDLIEKGYFPEGSKILAIHTGGLQGIAGMNAVLKKKNLPIIM
ncbi:1-aminocyclopropane-1-carboxylate deaminase/D-cysteine desulfhydrase [Algibacter amylolyticus]|uniref:1-aminocyclopropane-1-carboxylate deaminase/D-cysteine desulfhydrase n=1 Tax=Algibacter amylolyticus TaxID=1608400 RepID=A0A5M7BD53_9FLAO|nr:pyridoxal-phosphate dependent enzyme [Algibacter amylolyticus]KAA5826197.1 1-aminocyclopropane-1-carboxylate deaminase/D-cysteine desulfhydrase [Algibacter amylolyticus]MBB5268398.1 1-aminocyclopropane-1-carboxylate deaminase [Algibacter amylolyticus]TSJ80235.1 1-aminocyclopropane-1-carboxylate deaminase/D-cysteine desulfhydrase [Algibacter amylolyticus]